MSCTATPGLHNDGCDCPPEGVSLHITIEAMGQHAPVYDRLWAIATLTPATPTEVQHALGKLRAVVPGIDVIGVGQYGTQSPRLTVALQWGSRRHSDFQRGIGRVSARELETAARQLIRELTDTAEQEVNGA